MFVERRRKDPSRAVDTHLRNPSARPYPPPRRLHREALVTRRERLVLLASTLGFSMVLLDTTVVNVALGSIAHDLAAGPATLGGVANAHTLLFARPLLSPRPPPHPPRARARLPPPPRAVAGGPP